MKNLKNNVSQNVYDDVRRWVNKAPGPRFLSRTWERASNARCADNIYTCIGSGVLSNVQLRVIRGETFKE